MSTVPLFRKTHRATAISLKILINFQFALFAFFFLCTNVSAQKDFPPRPVPPRLVNDLAGFMSATEAQQLENKLVAFDDSTSTQIAIVTITDLGGYDIADYSQQLGELWGVGRKGKDNGALILASKNDRKVYITIGYGLEGAIPDALAKRIVDNTIVPAFKQGNFYKGFEEGTTELMGLATGEFNQDDVGRGGEAGNVVPIILIILVIFIVMIISSRKKNKYHTYTGKGHRSGGWGGPIIFGGGGGWGGGGGGGGFGGFGGGSFGGGGAGGSW